MDAFRTLESGRDSEAAGVPVLEAVLGDGDEDVLAPDAERLEARDDGAVELALGVHAVHVHHEDLDEQETAAVDAAEAAELELARLVRPEDVEEVVGDDVERVDLRLLDLATDGVAGGLVDLPLEIDLDERHVPPRRGARRIPSQPRLCAATRVSLIRGQNRPQLSGQIEKMFPLPRPCRADMHVSATTVALFPVPSGTHRASRAAQVSAR